MSDELQLIEEETKVMTPEEKVLAYVEAKKKEHKLYEDKEFTYTETSYFRPEQLDFDGERQIKGIEVNSRDSWCVFKKENPAVWDGTTMGHEWLTSTALALAFNETQLLKKVFFVSDHRHGIHILRLRGPRGFAYVACDESFPGSGDGRNSAWRFRYASTRDRQLWLQLIEKAMAKLRGGYDKLRKGQCSTAVALTALTGRAVETTRWTKEENEQAFITSLLWAVVRLVSSTTPAAVEKNENNEERPISMKVLGANCRPVWVNGSADAADYGLKPGATYAVSRAFEQEGGEYGGKQRCIQIANHRGGRPKNEPAFKVLKLADATKAFCAAHTLAWTDAWFESRRIDELRHESCWQISVKESTTAVFDFTMLGTLRKRLVALVVFQCGKTIQLDPDGHWIDSGRGERLVATTEVPAPPLGTEHNDNSANVVLKCQLEIAAMTTQQGTKSLVRPPPHHDEAAAEEENLSPQQHHQIATHFVLVPVFLPCKTSGTDQEALPYETQITIATDRAEIQDFKCLPIAHTAARLALQAWAYTDSKMTNVANGQATYSSKTDKSGRFFLMGQNLSEQKSLRLNTIFNKLSGCALTRKISKKNVSHPEEKPALISMLPPLTSALLGIAVPVDRTYSYAIAKKLSLHPPTATEEHLGFEPPLKNHNDPHAPIPISALDLDSLQTFADFQAVFNF